MAGRNYAEDIGEFRVEIENLNFFLGSACN